jgi:hypothetical protein
VRLFRVIIFAGMTNSILITPNSKSDIAVLKAIAKKMGFKAIVLTREQQEELGLLNAMLEGRKTRLIPKSTVLKTLNG